MARKRTAPGAPLWMVTYSDMVTLLMTFFVMLLAMANFDEMSKVNAVMGSIRVALGSGDSGEGVGAEVRPDVEDSEAKSPLEATGAQLREALAQHASKHFIQLTQTETEIRIRLSDRIMFETGKSTLYPTAYQILKEVSRSLKGKNVFVEVHGHADGTGRPESNWQVSSDRALAVLNELQSRGELDGRFMRAVAMGQYHPADLETGSSDWNRRVELVIRSRDGVAFEVIQGLEGQ